MDIEKDIVPEQHHGSESNTESSKSFSSEEDAKEFFKKVADRLLHVNEWHYYAGKATAEFQLADEKGNVVHRPVEKGDHFRIDIPGPGPATGDGFDWVRVEEILTVDDCVTIRVRPATNPTNDKQDVAHFFDENATSSFVVKKEGNKVTAAVYGRNEKPNTHTEKVVDTVRNAAVATGAVSGFSKMQWKSLVEGLLKS